MRSEDLCEDEAEAGSGVGTSFCDVAKNRRKIAEHLLRSSRD